MYQNACFESLRATRKAALGRAIAERMAARDGEQSDRLADIAVLFEVARDGVRAAEYWNRAAQAAGRLYAHDESARLAERGLALLAREPASPERSAAELGLLMDYAPQLGRLDVPDPYYGGHKGFEEVLDLVEAAVEGLIEEARTRPR